MKRKKFAVFIIILVLSVLIPGSFFMAEKEGGNYDGSGLFIERLNGTVRLAAGNFGAQVKERSDLFAVMQSLADTYGIEDATREFVYSKAFQAPFGFSYKLSQVYKGTPVFGRSVTVATDKDGKVLSVSGNYLKDIRPVNGVKITVESAADAVASSYPGLSVLSVTLEIYSLENVKPAYCYNVLTNKSGGTRFFVDAKTGAIIAGIATSPNETIPTLSHRTEQTDYYNKSVEAYIEKTVSAGEDGHTYYLADCMRNIYLLDAKNAVESEASVYENKTGIFEDKAAVSAFLNFVAAFDFYDNAENIGVRLRGIDGSVNNVHDDAESAGEILIYAYMHYGQNYENAGYMHSDNDKEAVFIFGDGNKDRLYDLAVSRDVVGHEYQHAVTAHSADLIYLNAAGAINEAFSDVFGALIEGHELTDESFWLSGEDICSSSYQKAIRDMKDPLSLSQPDKYNGSYFVPFCYRSHDHGSSSCDSGGLHTNSTVISHAAYNMFNAEPELFTKQVMGELWYSTLLLLPSDSEFSDVRILMRQAAIQLGYDERIITAITNAFDSASITGSGGEHTISFNKTDMSGTAPQTIRRNYGETFTIPVAALTKEGYTLKGWSVSGTTDDKIYYEGQSYRMPGYNLTLRPVCAIAMWNNLAPSVWEGGGTHTNPYLIQSAADLATIAYYVNNYKIIKTDQPVGWNYFKMTCDIDLLNIPWIPIGIEGTDGSINGAEIRFDGAGHKILNLNISGEALSAVFKAQGLFGKLAAKIKNLGIESGSINTSANYVGAIAGSVVGRIENCYNKISVTNTYSVIQNGDYENRTGGLAGRVYYGLQGCYNTGNITGKDSVGGLAGAAGDYITNCFNSGSVTGGTEAGGLFGTMQYPFLIGGYDTGGETVYGLGNLTVSNSYNTGKICGENAGGIGGRSTDTYYSNCINTGEIGGVSAQSSAGGIVGWLNPVINHNYLRPVVSYNDSSYVGGCKNTGVIDTQNALYAGAIAGKVFGDNLSGAVIFEKNTFKNQQGLSDIGNADLFDEKMSSMFKGERAKLSDDAIFSGEFDFDSADYYSDVSRWTATGKSTYFEMGYEWQTAGQNAMPVQKTTGYWLDDIAESFAGGKGTEKAPYLISTPQQLALLAWATTINKGKVGEKYVSGSFFELTNDIDLAGLIWVSIDRSINHLGSGANLDGKGYTIKNMYARDYVQISGDVPNYSGYTEHISFAGLFGQLDGAVKNVKLENCNVFSRYTAGGIASSVWKNMEQVSSCEVISGIIVGRNLAGGIIGSADLSNNRPNKFLSLYNNASVVSSGWAGGLFGEIMADFLDCNIYVENCVNTGSVTAFGSNATLEGAAGGLIGTSRFSLVNIKNCISGGRITSHDFLGNIGGLIGFLDSGTARNSSKKMDFYRINVSKCVVSAAFGRVDSRFSSFGALLCFKYLSYNDWSACDFAINLDGVYYSGAENALPLRRGDYAFLSVTEKNVNYSVVEEDFDFTNIEYFFSKKYFDAETETANLLYYFMNGEFKEYDVIFKDAYNEDLSRQKVMHGKAAIEPEIPQKAADKQYTYAFKEWDNAFDEVKSNLAISPVYNETLNKYTYTFFDEDGKTVLKTVTADYGSVITAPAEPVKSGTAQYSYTFSGWGDGFSEGAILTDNISFTAKFTSSVNQYTYVFCDEDGKTVLKSVTADYGSVIAAPDNPVKERTAQYTYTFAYFSGFESGAILTGDVKFTAVYNETVNKYTYTFFDEDGKTVLKTVTADYGSVITATAEPVKSGTAQYSYIFSWTPDFSSGKILTQDVYYTAKFTECIKAYTVTFKDGSKTLSKKTLAYGSAIELIKDPVKKRHIFKGWSTDADGNNKFTEATLEEDITLYAVFEKESGCKTALEGNAPLWILPLVTLAFAALILRRRKAA